MVTTTEFDELLDVLRDFIRHEVMPAEADIDSSDEIPAQLIAQAKEMGLYGYALPTEYGGLGLSVEQQVRVTIELGYTSPAFRSLFGTNNGIAGQVLVLAGTEEQRKQWLPRLASGEVVASFALTEPDAGSDPSRLTTAATADGRRLGHRRPQALHHQRPGGRRLWSGWRDWPRVLREDLDIGTHDDVIPPDRGERDWHRPGTGQGPGPPRRALRSPFR